MLVLWNSISSSTRRTSFTSCFLPTKRLTMCVGVTVLTLPPTVVCLGYLSWLQGSNFCHERLLLLPQFNVDTKRKRHTKESKSSLASFLAGMATLVGTYWLISLSFPYLETSDAQDKLKQHTLEPSNSTTVSRTAKRSGKFQRITHQSQTGYRPPENIMEIVYKVTPPLSLRLGTTTVAFFCAGVTQTFVAFAMS